MAQRAILVDDFGRLGVVRDVVRPNVAAAALASDRATGLWIFADPVATPSPLADN